jgi:transcriptional regulator with XRE-family HTH domain
MSPPPLTSAQIRAARALIRWSAEDLARHSSVSVTTIRRAECRSS